MQECNHDDCDFPAQFHARLETTGPITAEIRVHESGNLCQYHTNEAAEMYKGSKNARVKIESI